jgi:hypothetical protein
MVSFKPSVLDEIHAAANTPVYATKNATQFAQKSQQFDQNVTPQMSRVMSIPDPNARKAAVQAQIAQNPGLKSNYQWALSNGLLQ